MVYATATITSPTPAKDLMAALAAPLTTAGFTLVDSYATPAVTNWSAVGYGGGQFLAVVSGINSAATSPDGVTWTHRVLPTSAAWTAVAYGNGVWVVLVNNSATYLTSPDGVTWTQRAMPVSGLWGRTLTFGGGLFVALAGNTAYTSPDGVTWTARTLPTNQTWQSAAYGGGLFVAVTTGTNVAVSSPDAITWTQRTLGTSQSWSSVAYGAGVFVAVTAGTTVAVTSPDGITWTQRVMPAAVTWAQVAYGAGLFVAVPAGFAYTATSPDGITWTQRAGALPSNPSWVSIAYGGGLFVATANGSATSATSADGLTFTARNLTGITTTASADVYKSAAGSNVFGSDWYLILRRAADTSPQIWYQVAELYDQPTHRAANLGGMTNATAPTAGTFTNPVPATAPDGATSGNACLNLTTTAFTFMVSATADRIILGVKAAAESGFYAGLYEDLLPAGTTQFPLVAAQFPTNVTATSIGGGGITSAGGFTREPGQTAGAGLNFEACIFNGYLKANNQTFATASGFTPMTTSAALYGNAGSLSRVPIGSARTATYMADAVRGLLYGCLSSMITSLAGDTITSAGKTYVRFTGAAATYGYFVDQAL